MVGERAGVTLAGREVVVVIGPVGHVAGVEADADDVEHVARRAAQVARQVDDLPRFWSPTRAPDDPRVKTKSMSHGK